MFLPRRWRLCSCKRIAGVYIFLNPLYGPCIPLALKFRLGETMERSTTASKELCGDMDFVLYKKKKDPDILARSNMLYVIGIQENNPKFGTSRQI